VSAPGPANPDPTPAPGLPGRHRSRVPAVVGGAIGLVALLLTALLLARVVGPPRPTADLVLVNTNETYTLDPQRMSFLQDLRLAGVLYEGLTRVHPDTGAAVPALAESWSVSEDGRRWTFRLRDDARWSSGAPVTAHDVAFAWMRALLPDTAARGSGLFMAIRGARGFFQWRADALANFAATRPAEPAAAAAAAAALWRETEEAFGEQVGLRVLGDHALEIVLEQPVPYLPDLLAYGAFSPVWRPAVEGWPDADAAAWPHGTPPPMDRRRWVRLDPETGRYRQDHRWARPGRHVGNGPYSLARWRYKRDLRLQRNAFWSRPDREPQAESILFLTIEDPNTAILALETGQVDWIIDVGSDAAADLLAQQAAWRQRHAADAGRDVGADTDADADARLAALPAPDRRRGERRNAHATPAFGTDFFSFNCRPRLADGRENPFHDAAVRRAFVLATDRRAIVDGVTRLGEPVATTLVPPGSIPGYESPVGLGHDPERARAELAAAGWVDRDGDGVPEDAAGTPFPAVEILYTTTTPRYRWISIALRDQWRQVLGVPVELRGVDTKFYREDLRNGAFMVARGRWYGDYGDPTTFLELFRSDDPSNDRGFRDPAVDASLDAAATETDPGRRMQRLAELERTLFTEHVPMLTLCQLVRVSMHDPVTVRGVGRHPRLVQDLARVRRVSPELEPEP
jgi:oligopeptide transport system substrate-binding protein